jgi:hypothetical protein
MYRVWISSQDAAAVAEKNFRFVHAPSDYFYLDCGAGEWIGDTPTAYVNSFSIDKPLTPFATSESAGVSVQLFQPPPFTDDRYKTGDPFKSWQEVRLRNFSHWHTMNEN